MWANDISRSKIGRAEASRLRILLLGVGACLLLLVLAAPPSARAGQVLNAPRDSGDFIRMLVATVPGDTVLVGPGEYRGHFIVPSGVAVMSSRGPDSTIFWGGGVVIFELRGGGPSTTIKGLTFNCQRGGEIAILDGGSSPLIEGNVIIKSHDGISCTRGAPVIRGNTISGCRRGIALEACQGIIEENHIFSNTDGIYLTSSSPSIERNHIERNRVGIELTYYSYPLIGGGISRANDFERNRRHIYNAALATVGATRTQDLAVLSAKYNYWGTLCPSQSDFFGKVMFKPWIDAAHENRFIKCPEETDTGAEENQTEGAD